MSLESKSWVDLTMHGAKALFLPEGRKAVIVKNDGADFNAKTQAGFAEFGFEKGMMGSSIAYVKSGSLSGKVLKTLFPRCKKVILRKKEDFEAILVTQDILPFEGKKAVDSRDVDWLVDAVASATQEDAEQASPEVEAADVLAVPEGGSAPAEEEVAESAPEAAQAAPANTVASNSNLTEFEAFLVYEGVPKDIRKEFLEAVKEINRVFAGDLESIVYNGKLAPSEFRKEFGKRTPRKDLAKLKIADRVYPFMRSFRGKSEDERAEYVSFASEKEGLLENYYRDFELGVSELKQKSPGNEINGKDPLVTFDAGVRIGGLRAMTEFLMAEDMRQHGKDLLKDPRFSMLSSSQLNNFKYALLSNLKKDELITAAITREWRNNLEPEAQAPAPGM